MRQKTGEYIVRMYDKYGHKEGWTYAKGFIHGCSICKEHEEASEGNTASLSRVLYNTHDADKWSYTKQ
jgi:hypothetical protein